MDTKRASDRYQNIPNGAGRCRVLGGAIVCARNETTDFRLLSASCDSCDASVLHTLHCSRKCDDDQVRSQQLVEKFRYPAAVLARPQACPGPMLKATGSNSFALYLSSRHALDVSRHTTLGVVLHS